MAYDEVATSLIDTTDIPYTWQPAELHLEMAYLKSSGAAAPTVSQALTEIKAQLAPSIPPATKPGDVNGDGAVNIFDMSTMLSNWGMAGAAAGQGDVNGDGMINALDLSVLLANWNS